MIYPCDKPCGNKTASGYCATTACINPQYSSIGTVQYGQGVQKRIVTNADRIRAMNDEELTDCMTDDFCELLCKSPISCDGQCNSKMLHWLKEEAK